jgi:HSP20 family protein
MDKDFDWRPTADISESKKHYMIKAELPEVEKDDVHVSVENGMLTISGERRHERDEETETQHRIERMYGKFSRSFKLPPDIDESAISAETRNGVLKVKLPKTKQTESKPVQISVK